jgi:cobalamin biosynthesis Mg chelatase CobN
MQGRKSKTARALGCLIAAMLAFAALAPAVAAAQSGAEDEYELAPNIPNSDDSNQQSNAGGGVPQSGSGGGSSGPTATAPTTEPTTGGETSQGSGGDGKANASQGDGKGANGSQATSTQTPAQVPSIASDSSDDGGAPVLLILLAIIAAVCTGVAIWRLRRQPEPTERESAQGAKPTTSAASETNSL